MQLGRALAGTLPADQMRAWIIWSTFAPTDVMQTFNHDIQWFHAVQLAPHVDFYEIKKGESLALVTRGIARATPVVRS